MTTFHAMSFNTSDRFYCALLILLITSSGVQNSEDDCTINVHRDLNKSKTALLLSNKKPPGFVYPNPLTPSIVRLNDDEPIRFECGGRTQLLDCRKKSGDQPKKLSCDGLAKFMSKEKKVNCPSNVECLTIGFPLNIFDFVPTIDLIYLNPGRKRPLWAHAKIVPIIAERQKSGQPVNQNFKTCEFFDGISSVSSMDEIYDKFYQKTRLSKLLGDESLAEQYINDEGATIFQPGGEQLVRGLLIDRQDFFYFSQQSTTQHYANVMPMWKSVVNGNWKASADFVRKLAASVKTSLEVWSGGYGTLELPDTSGVKKTVYMAMDDQANEVVPVPKLLFRYAYNRESNQGVVIITVNNPFVRKLTSDLALCKEQNLCHQMYSRMKIFPMGYTYCCSLKDFADTAKRRGLPVFNTAKPF